MPTEKKLTKGLLIRADADDRIGTGHVMRCLALAQAWRECHLGPVWLVSCALPERLRRRYVREGARVCMVEPGGSRFSAALHDLRPTWVALDGYGFGVREQRLAKNVGCRLLVIDDDGVAGAYVADLIVDANIFAEERSYANSGPQTRLLLGPRYALLRRELRTCEPMTRRDHTPSRVLVTFGGADPRGLSLLAVNALEGTDLQVTLVLGPANSRGSEVERAAAAATNVRVVGDPENMRNLMDGADLAIVAGGGTCLELAHAGIPQLIVATAENQKRVARALVDHGLARSMGNADGLTAKDIRHAVFSLLHDPAVCVEMRTRGQALVDGRGAPRVVEAMVALNG